MQTTLVNWTTAWQEGSLGDVRSFIELARSKPTSIANLMLLLPPLCLVRATTSLRCPAPGTVGLVSGYFEPTPLAPDGFVGVLPHPGAPVVGHCNPEWLQVVGYWKGLSPQVLSSLLSTAA